MVRNEVPIVQHVQGNFVRVAVLERSCLAMLFISESQ